MTGRPTLGVLAATHIAALGTGFVLAPKQPVDIIVKDDGLLKHTTSTVLATTVESLHNENKLLVFSYKGTATVEAQSSFLWLFGGRQELSVPAVVPYYLDLTGLTLADVDYNEKAKLVTVKLPRVTLGTIAFEPERVMAIDAGVLTWSESEVEALRKLNYVNARRAMVAEAQQPELVDQAKRQAQANITSLFEIPLRIAGLPDVKVVTTFK